MTNLKSKAIAYNVFAMRSAGLRGTHYQITQAYERGRTLDITNKPAVIKSAFKCDDIELQPIECEKWRGCFDCPHYKAVL